MLDVCDGELAGQTLVDCTNPIDYPIGELKPASSSSADVVARGAPGSHAVKASHPITIPGSPSLTVTRRC